MAEQFACTGNARLNLITDEQDIVLITQSSRLPQIVIVGNDNACFALNRLYQEGGKVGSRVLKGLPQGCLVIVLEGLVGSRDCASDTWQIRTVVFARLGIARQGNGSELDEEGRSIYNVRAN